MSPQGEVLEQSFQVGFKATKNMAEYEALLVEIGMERNLGAINVEIFNDSQLVVNQVNRKYESK